MNDSNTRRLLLIAKRIMALVCFARAIRSFGLGPKIALLVFSYWTPKRPWDSGCLWMCLLKPFELIVSGAWNVRGCLEGSHMYQFFQNTAGADLLQRCSILFPR